MMNIKLGAAVLAAALAMTGCATRTTNIPTHNLGLRADVHEHVLSLAQVEAGQRPAALKDFLAGVHETDTAAAIRAGEKVSQDEINAVKEVLLGSGFPERAVKIQRAKGETALQCAVYEEKGLSCDHHWYSTAAVGPDFGRASQYNLDASANNRARLAKGAELGPQNPMGAIGPVERYQSGQVRELRDVNVSVGGSSSSSSSGS